MEKCFHDLVGVFSATLFDFIPFDCLFPNYEFFHSLLGTTLLPIGISAVLLFIVRFNPWKLRRNALTLFFLLTYIVYPSCSTKVLNVWTCATYVVSGDPDFDDDEWELRIVGKGVTRYDEEQAKYIWGKITAFNYDSYMYRVRYDDGVLDTILLKDIRGYLVTECAKCGRSTNNNEHVMLCDGARCFNEYHMRCLELDSVRSVLSNGVSI